MQRHPTIDDVVAAQGRLKDLAVRTPLIENTILNDRLGGRVLIKPECLQRIGAFKFRGAYNALSQLDREKYPGGVVTCSSGNHAQGIAEAARLLGLKAAIVMPSDAPCIKVRGVRRSGGEVIVYDRATEDRDKIAMDLASQRCAAFVPPYDDPDIIAGQATAGLEITEQVAGIGASLDMMLVPVGGGGLISGVALAVKSRSPATDVIGVEPAGFDDFARSLDAGERRTNARSSGSICDALLSPTPGELTFAVAAPLLSQCIAVSDDEVRDAIKYAFEILKLVVEPGGAVALAALLTGRISAKGKTVGILLSGGNIDGELFAEILAA